MTAARAAPRQPEDADHLVVAQERDGAHLDRRLGAVGPQHVADRIGGRDRAQKLPGEHALRARPVGRRDDVREALAAGVADELLRGRVEPDENPVLVDDVGGDVDVGERALHVRPQTSQDSRHPHRVSARRAQRSSALAVV